MTDTELPTPSEQLVPPPPPAEKPKKRIGIIVGILVFVALLISLLFMQSQKNSDDLVVPTPTPFEIITPTPIRKPSEIASSSAFIEFSNEVTEFSNAINSFTFQDATLVPPLFDTTIEIAP